MPSSRSNSMIWLHSCALPCSRPRIISESQTLNFTKWPIGVCAGSIVRRPSSTHWWLPIDWLYTITTLCKIIFLAFTWEWVIWSWVQTAWIKMYCSDFRLVPPSHFCLIHVERWQLLFPMPNRGGHGLYCFSNAISNVWRAENVHCRIFRRKKQRGKCVF